MKLMLISQVAALLMLAGAASAQTNEPTKSAPQASDGGKAVLVEPRPVAESDDAVNAHVLAGTANGLALSLTIDGSTVALNSVAAARVPLRQARPSRDDAADTVTITGLSAGRIVASTVVPDTVLNASEGDGLVRLTRRQVSAVLVANTPIDTLQVSAPATAASATLDVRSAYARLCEAAPGHDWCPKPSPR
ncbi:MAG TPA: hypothetical protein VGF12_23390 [Roseateles sp.]|uniref:hypothetical protein n=1 Tax=Roseateles sp. TaxID=1971397 RepID=UPI002EDB0073